MDLLKSVDSVYTDVPRTVMQSILGEVLEDLVVLYREKCDECAPKSDVGLDESGFEKILKEMGMKEWGSIDDFESLIIDLAEMYKKQIEEIMGRRDFQSLEIYLQKKVQEISCKYFLAESLFRNSASLRMVRSDSPTGKMAVMLYNRSIYTAEIFDKEGLMRKIRFEEKGGEDEIIPGYT
jgi:hypothetical protein